MMSNREIVLDTETTGLDPASDRIVEIGCVEMVDGVPTGDTFQAYVNPQRSVPWSAVLVHGLDDTFLAGKPVFSQIADAFLEFIADAPLVIHNAKFDLAMLNAELRGCGRPALAKSRALDTVSLAREKRPGKPASLDALAAHFKIKADREKHGALADARLLADVYIALTGGRQRALEVTAAKSGRVLDGLRPCEWTPRLVQPSAEEAAAHRAFIATIPNAIWHAVW